jgi:ATP-dependent Clp protease ATP-binding subunit ClpC
MFERYTEPARRTLFFARYEASQLGGGSIETEHVLLGLLRESGSVVGRIFLGADVSYQGVRKQIGEVTTAGPRVPLSVEMPFTKETKRVLHYAAEEADRMEHRQIGTEHLLLGLLRERGTIAERNLTQKGLSADRVRKQIRDEGQLSADESASPPSRIEALMALERVSTLLAQLIQASNADVPELVVIIQSELDLVRRALNA